MVYWLGCGLCFPVTGVCSLLEVSGLASFVLGVWPALPPVQLVLGALSPGVRWLRHELYHSIPFSDEVYKCLELYWTSPYMFMSWCVDRHRDNFTFHLPCVCCCGGHLCPLSFLDIYSHKCHFCSGSIESLRHCVWCGLPIPQHTSLPVVYK